MIAASGGAPDLLGAHIEAFVAEHWSIEVGGGVGLLPLSIHAGLRWSPQGVCPGCWSGHAFRLAPGALVFIFPSIPQEGMAVVDADAAWVWYRGQGMGVTAGVRLGVGLAWGPSSDGVKIEPSIEVIPLQLGVVF